MELESRDSSLLLVVLEQLSLLPPGTWLDTLSIYRNSRIVSYWNRLASEGSAYFCGPQDLVDAIRRDKTLRVKLVEDGAWVLVSMKTKLPSISRTLSAVLRYDVSEWIRVTSLKTLLHAKSKHQRTYSSAEVLWALLSDRDRFEVSFWQGETWVKAAYRYGF